MVEGALIIVSSALNLEDQVEIGDKVLDEQACAVLNAVGVIDQ